MKRVISGILALLLILTVVPCENMGKVQAAGEDYAVFATCGYEQDGSHLFAWEGDDVTLNVKVADCNQNDEEVDITGTDYSLKWYLVVDGELTAITGANGTAYTITDITKEQLYSYDYYRFVSFECKLFKGSVEKNHVSFYIHNIDDSFGEVNTSKHHPIDVREGWKPILGPDNNDLEIMFAEAEIDFKWYRISGDRDGTYLVHELVSEERILQLEALTEGDYAKSQTEDVDRGYVREATCRGRLLKKHFYWLYEHRLPTYTMNVGGQTVMKNGKFIKELPEGVEYDADTNTLTFDNYTFETETSMMLYADGDLNVVLKGTNIYRCTGTGTTIRTLGRLNISGSGSLNIYAPTGLWEGIQARRCIEIRDCTIRMDVDNQDQHDFYGITLEADTNCRSNIGGEYCQIKLQDATLDIKSNCLEYESNNGINAQDANITINNSDIRMELNGGLAYGIVAGAEHMYGQYGGIINVDSLSNIVIDADAKGYLMYYYMGNVASPYVYASQDAIPKLQEKTDVFLYSSYDDRTEALWTHLEIGTHEWNETITPATTEEAGKIVYTCTTCDATRSDVIIPQFSGEVCIIEESCWYTGQACEPSVYVADENGKPIDQSLYTVSYDDNVEVGTAKAIVELQGIYSGTLIGEFKITWAFELPGKLSAKLYGYNDVEVTWGRDYNTTYCDIYYKASTWKTYKKLGTTEGASWRKANLSDGVKYTFKIVPYWKSYAINYYGKPETVSIYTLKKLSAPTVKKSSSSKVKVSWKNISGESGYQISQSTKKSKTKIVSTYNTTSGKSKTIKATKKKAYYYKVRAYKTVGSKKIYGPWSSVKAYKLK